MKARPRGIRQQRELFDAWKDIPEGVRVVVRMDDNQEYSTTITARALMLGGRTAVVWLDGINGCYALERVRKATEVDGHLPNEMALKARRA